MKSNSLIDPLLLKTTKKSNPPDGNGDNEKEED